MKQGGFLTADDSNQSSTCSEQTFNGSDVKSKFDDIIGNMVYWTKSTYTMGGEMEFIVSSGVSDVTVTLESFIGGQRFEVLVKLPSC